MAWPHAAFTKHYQSWEIRIIKAATLDRKASKHWKYQQISEIEKKGGWQGGDRQDQQPNSNCPAPDPTRKCEGPSRDSHGPGLL